MDRLLPTLIIVAALLVIFALMALGWRSRQRRQAGVARPSSVPESLAAASLVVDGWYVATTVGDEPLERIAVHGLGFRGRATVSVHPEGLVITVRSRDAFFIAAAELRGAGRATWAIDRVVERDGLVLVGWMLGAAPVDTYLRVPDAMAATALVTAVQATATETTTTEGIAS
ncbi:MAG: hypothetical protein RL499_1177 [Actinomycetota bacterium]